MMISRMKIFTCSNVKDKSSFKQWKRLEKSRYHLLSGWDHPLVFTNFLILLIVLSASRYHGLSRLKDLPLWSFSTGLLGFISCRFCWILMAMRTLQAVMMMAGKTVKENGKEFSYDKLIEDERQENERMDQRKEGCGEWKRRD